MKVYMADASPLCDESCFEAAYRRVSWERQRKIDRFRFRKDKILSLTAGLLLQRALTEAGVQNPDIAYTPKGKPCLINHEPALFFSLSHSGTKAMCVLGDHPVGCDIEKLAPPPLMVGRHVFSKDEQIRLSRLKGEVLKRQFFRLWTGKESYLKMTGEGLSGKPADFSIELPYGSQVIKGREVTFLEIPCEGEYQAAVCMEGRCRKEAEVYHLNATFL